MGPDVDTESQSQTPFRHLTRAVPQPAPSPAHSGRYIPIAPQRLADDDFSTDSSTRLCTPHSRTAVARGPAPEKRAIPSRPTPSSVSRACIHRRSRSRPLLAKAFPLQTSSLEKASYALQSQLRCCDFGNSQSKVPIHHHHFSSRHNTISHYKVDRLRYMSVQLHNISRTQFQYLAQRHIARSKLQRRIQFNVTQRPYSQVASGTPSCTHHLLHRVLA